MDTPNCDKMVAVAAESQKVGAFIDWLGEQGMAICARTGRNVEPYWPINDNIEQLLARYFEIDLDAVEVERRAILASLPVS